MAIVIPTRPDFPIGIDSTMRAAFCQCPTKFKYEFIWNIRPARISRHLHAGAAFAKGLEVARRAHFQQGLTRKDSEYAGYIAFTKEYGTFEVGEDETKSYTDMLGALDYYWQQWPLGLDPAVPHQTPRGPAIEFSFSIPIPGVFHPQTGEPLIYMGRFDQLVESSGMLLVEDDKTASQLGPTWPRQFEMRAQMTGYCWAAREFGYDVQGALIRAVAILKNGYNHAQTIISRPEWQVQRWLEQLKRDASRMIECWTTGVFDYDLDSSCASYGGCPYMQLCQVKEPKEWLEPDYVISVWNPLGHVTDKKESKDG